MRRVPRELLDDLRSRVIHYVSEAKNFSAEIHQIAGKPPQLVLSLDGNIAEDYNTNSKVADDHAKTNIILVQNIPPSLDEEFLELFFESKKKKGGGPVKHIKLDKEKHWAVVEFYEPEAVDVVLAKRPITMLDTTVDIQPYLPLLARGDHLTSLDIQGLPSKLTEDILAAQLNSILSTATALEVNHEADEVSSEPDERVIETITNIRELHLRYLQESDFQKRMKGKFPNLSITIQPTKTVIVDGHASEIKAVKLDLKNVIDCLLIHTVDNIDRQQLEIIQSKEAIDYITKLLKSLKLVAVWEVNSGKLVFCCSQEGVMFCQRIILESVKVKIVTTPFMDASIVYRSDLWKEYVNNIDKKYKGMCKLYLNHDQSGVIIVSTDNVVEEIVHEVQKFHTDHTIVQLTLIADNVDGMLDFKKVLDQAFLSVPKHFLKVVSWNNKSSAFMSSTFSFTLKGTMKGIRLLKMILSNKHNINVFF